jgi:hypothetical protein
MRIFGLIATLLVLAAPASADPVVLQASSLHDRPGVVTVDAQDVTTITFCRAIAWSAYKAPWLHAAISAQDKRVLLLDATTTSGETTLMVWIEGDGMPLQLLVRASARELGNHLYTVTCPAEVAQVVTPSNSVVPPVRMDSTKPPKAAARQLHRTRSQALHLPRRRFSPRPGMRSPKDSTSINGTCSRRSSGPRLRRIA